MQKTVSQIDLVPTISLLLGLPVPFSSLGTVVLDLFSHCPWWPARGSRIKRVYHVVKALRLNANQVGRSDLCLLSRFTFVRNTMLSSAQFDGYSKYLLEATKCHKIFLMHKTLQQRNIYKI